MRWNKKWTSVCFCVTVSVLHHLKIILSFRWRLQTNETSIGQISYFTISNSHTRRTRPNQSRIDRNERQRARERMIKNSYHDIKQDDQMEIYCWLKLILLYNNRKNIKRTRLYQNENVAILLGKHGCFLLSVVCRCCMCWRFLMRDNSVIYYIRQMNLVLRRNTNNFGLSGDSVNH